MVHNDRVKISRLYEKEQNSALRFKKNVPGKLQWETECRLFINLPANAGRRKALKRLM